MGAMRVLVVDDFPFAAQASSNLFELFGHETRVALTAQDALTQFTKFEPDIVVLDIDLPDRDGLAVAREIRASDRGARVFLAALTGLDGIEPRSLDTLFDCHVIKPASAQKLLALVEAARTGVSIA
jgi:DNA-binding response OmpR family regulator